MKMSSWILKLLLIFKYNIYKIFELIPIKWMIFLENESLVIALFYREIICTLESCPPLLFINENKTDWLVSYDCMMNFFFLGTRNISVSLVISLQTFHCQRALEVWKASASMSLPLSWDIAEKFDKKWNCKTKQGGKTIKISKAWNRL